MSLLGWGVVMVGVWVALNVVLYGILDWYARYPQTQGWISLALGGGHGN